MGTSLPQRFSRFCSKETFYLKQGHLSELAIVLGRAWDVSRTDFFTVGEKREYTTVLKMNTDEEQTEFPFLIFFFKGNLPEIYPDSTFRHRVCLYGIRYACMPDVYASVQ